MMLFFYLMMQQSPQYAHDYKPRCKSESSRIYVEESTGCLVKCDEGERYENCDDAWSRWLTIKLSKFVL